ncbi:MFS transporter [Actinoplanes sp. NPDC051475]|uniref:MFS transporter n=1 Tax=Actinoplanes sp. NPDC051475 TaxID=3157225 RepID=UPI00344C3CBF
MSQAPTSSPDSTVDPAAGDNRSWLVRRGLLLESVQQRRLATGTFINQLGTGAFLATVPLYGIRVLDLSVQQVGLGLSIAAVVGLVAGIPVGHLADRRGPREIYLLTLLVQAVAMVGLLFAHSFWAFALAVTITDLAGSSGGAARGPLVRRVGGDEVPKFRSYLRSVAMLAGTFGALSAGVVVQIDTDLAYQLLIIGNALTFVGCALVMAQMPKLPPLPSPPEVGRWIALKDKPYVAFVVLDGIMWIQGEVLTFALPLWVVLHTDAPRWFVGLAIAVNTAMVVLFQVRASRGVEGGSAAGRAFRRAGVAFLLGMAIVAFAAGIPGWLAATIMVLGVGIHTIGELWHAAGSLELRFRMAPAHAQGQYSGVFGMGMGLCYVVAPSLLGLLLITWGKPGWFLMGGVFVLAGLAMPAVVKWGERTRPEMAEAVA